MRLESVVLDLPAFKCSHALAKELISRFNANKPCHIKAGLQQSQADALITDWCRFMDEHTTEYTTNEGPVTDAVRSRVHTHAVKHYTLQRVWREPRRIETQLGKKDDGCPVHSWLTTSAVPLCVAAAGMQRRLELLAQNVVVGNSEVLCPSFITGELEAVGGGPTHIDDYHSWVTLLTGEKLFYFCEPKSYIGVKGTGGKTERRDVTPWSPLVDNAAWRYVHLRPGDIFFLPRNWWHYVESGPHCVMTNVWVRPTDE